MGYLGGYCGTVLDNQSSFCDDIKSEINIVLKGSQYVYALCANKRVLHWASSRQITVYVTW